MMLAGGCASNRNWTMIPPLDQNRHKQQIENVTVAAECWTADEDMRVLFKKVPRGNVVALRVIIYNYGDKTVRFSRTQLKLRLSDGVELSPVPPSELTESLETQEAAVGAVIIMLTGGYGGGIAGAITESNARDNWNRQSAVRKCTMDLATVDSGQAMTGFLYFRYTGVLPDRDKESPKLTCTINRMPRVSASPLNYEFPVALFDEKAEGKAAK
jgi:hypothetical protein